MRFPLVTSFIFLVLSIQAQAQAVSDLDWLAGYWYADEDGVQMEEFWSASGGGILLGMHKDVFPSGNAFFEFLRIEKRDGKLTFFASPKGSAPTPFYLSELNEEMVVFENVNHDYPQRIIYKRVGEFLHVQIEDNNKTNVKSWVWQRTNFN